VPRQGWADAPAFLTTQWILDQLHRSPDHATALYRQFVKEGRGVDVWAELRGGILLGGDEFVAELKPLLADYEAARELPRRERHAARPSLPELFANVRDRETRNRQIHAAVRIHEYRLQAVADFVGLSPSTISMIAARVAKSASKE
jgi:putative transposase